MFGYLGPLKQIPCLGRRSWGWKGREGIMVLELSPSCSCSCYSVQPNDLLIPSVHISTPGGPIFYSWVISCSCSLSSDHLWPQNDHSCYNPSSISIHIMDNLSLELYVQSPLQTQAPYKLHKERCPADGRYFT